MVDGFWEKQRVGLLIEMLELMGNILAEGVLLGWLEMMAGGLVTAEDQPG